MSNSDKFLEAAENGDLEQVKEYLDHGIEVNIEDKSGETALYKAAHNGHTDVVRLLIEKGGDVDAKNSHGETALFYASMRRHFEVVKLLIENGADVNMRQKEGDTPLFYMVTEAKFKRQDAERFGEMATLPQRLAPLIQIIRLLIDNGADVNMKNYAGASALRLAEQETLTDIARVLQSAGADEVDLASSAPKASVIINSKIDIVWNFLTTERNWKKWHGPVPKVKPKWQEGATLLWEGGGKSTIIKYLPQKELQMDDTSIRTIFRLQSADELSTQIEMIDIPIRGAAYSDGGVAHQRTMNEDLIKLKESIEKESNNTVFTKSQKPGSCPKCGYESTGILVCPNCGHRQWTGLLGGIGILSFCGLIPILVAVLDSTMPGIMKWAVAGIGILFFLGVIFTLSMGIKELVSKKIEPRAGNFVKPPLSAIDEQRLEEAIQNLTYQEEITGQTVEVLWLRKISGIRSQAAHLLGDLGDARAVAPLIAALKYRDKISNLINGLPNSDYGEVLVAAAEALGKIGDARAVEPLLTAGKGVFGIRDQILVKALEQIGTPAVKPLIVALKNKDYETRAVAASALSKIGDIQALEPLIAALKDKEKRVRSAAGWALGELKDARAVEPLINALKDNDKDVRKAVIKSLGELKDERAVEPLIAALKDNDKDVREAVIKSLGELKDERAVEPLITALKDDQEIWIRKAAVEALGELKDVRVVEPLVTALKDKWGGVREAAAKALGELKDVRAVEPLITALKDEDKDMRKVVADALGKLGDTRAVEPLIIALKDEFDVRRAVEEALGKLGWKPNE